MNYSQDVDAFRQNLVNDSVRILKHFTNCYIVILMNDSAERRKVCHLLLAARDPIGDGLSVAG